MSNSTTHLDHIQAAQAQKEVTANALFDAGSTAILFGRRASTSAGLTWGYFGGVFDVSGTPTVIANGTIALTASTTNYLYATSAGVVTKATSAPSGWPGPLASSAVALYEIVTGTATVTSWTDYRSVASPAIALTPPGGSTTQVQYNDGGAFGGDSRLMFDETTKILTGQFAIDSNAINAQTGTSYTLLAADNGKVVTLSNASAITLTVPSGLGAGFSCILIQLGAGTVTVTASSTTINSAGGLLDIGAQHGAASLVAYAADTFNLSGNLA